MDRKWAVDSAVTDGARRWPGPAGSRGACCPKPSRLPSGPSRRVETCAFRLKLPLTFGWLEPSRSPLRSVAECSAAAAPLPPSPSRLPRALRQRVSLFLFRCSSSPPSASLARNPGGRRSHARRPRGMVSAISHPYSLPNPRRSAGPRLRISPAGLVRRLDLAPRRCFFRLPYLIDSGR